MAAVLLITNGGRVRATYKGGAYIEIAFGTSECPTDVINVYDYAAGKPKIANTPRAVERVFVRWLKEHNPEILIFETRLMA